MLAHHRSDRRGSCHDFFFLIDISEGLAREVVVARVNNELWDASRPLEQDCTLELLKARISFPFLFFGDLLR